MKLDEAILGRRSIRKFLSLPVDRDLIGQVIAAGNEAPCAGGIQNWRFIIVNDESKKQKLAEASLQQMWIAQAPVVLVVCSEDTKLKRYYGMRGERLYSIQNCAAAVQNMCLKIVELGLASCWVSAFEEEAVSRELSLPEHVRPQVILPLGYPGEKVPRPMRFRLEDITYVGKYGGEGKVEFPEAYVYDYQFGKKGADKAEQIKVKSKSILAKAVEKVNTKLKKK
jgi:nitroreductase